MKIECVPNFSEGRDQSVIAALVEAIQSVDTVRLLDTTSDPDHNRSVFTFIGPPGAVAEAAFRAVRTASERIDLTRHSGVHPRLGAADVVPFVPISGATLSDCAALAHQTGDRIWKELHIPVYFYEAAALRPECERLENVRKLLVPPDLGATPHPTAGCVVIGARKFLVAWNINLDSTDLNAAKAIARAIRQASGGLPAVKAIGLPLVSRNQVQVSINLVDFEQTPLHAVFDAVARLCAEKGIHIAGSELIGMIPQAALDASAGHDLYWENLRPAMVLTA
jgi:glutamate formiminotransferase/glutamate formiminotransferase/formiminotetrahydrofolate cyclodeaminase